MPGRVGLALKTIPSIVCNRLPFVRLQHFALFLFLALVSFIFAYPAHAQIAGLTQNDIGNTGISGTYNYSAGTYTIQGAGSGIKGSADGFSYVSAPAAGNIEMTARVATLTNASSSPFAPAGLMMRESLNANGVEAFVGVTPQNGVVFTVRTAAGATATTTLGASITAPVYLRLVRSGSSFAGYQSSDGVNWIIVGSSSLSNMPASFLAGFAVTSNVVGTLNQATFDHAVLMTSVPQRSANLLLWLRADVGVTYSGTSVSQWQDQSGNGNNASQTTTANQPVFATNALNGLPAISFTSASAQWLKLSSGFSNFSGASIFIVTKPSTSFTTGARFLDFGNGNPSDNIILQETTTGTGSTGGAGFYVYNTTTTSSVTSATALTLNSYQMLEAIHTGIGLTATLYTNGIQDNQGAINNINNLTRTGNYIGKANNAGSYLQGQIAEILVFNNTLSSSQRQAVEAYFHSKYGIASMPTLDAPVITPGTSVWSSPQQVSIAADPGASIYFTVDGSTPTTSSTLYTGPFPVSATTTVKAIAAEPGFNNSAVATAVIQISGLPAGPILWLKSDTGVTTSGSNVTEWDDASGSGNNATQSVTASQPTLTNNAVNLLPALTFAGTSPFMTFANSTFADFTNGASIFIVTEPASPITAALRFFDFGTNTNRDNLRMLEAVGGVQLDIVSTAAVVTSVISTTALNTGSFQLLEAVHNGNGYATVFQNGIQTGQGAVNNISNVVRTGNFLGKANNNTNYFKGQIAEVLIYNRPLSAMERVQVEGYINSRYVFNIGAPVITPGNSIHSGPQTVTITADPGVTIFYTLNGGATQTYTAPFNITTTTTVQSYSVRTTPSQTSATTTALIQIDPNTANVPQDSSLLAWLKSDNGVTTSGTSVISMADFGPNGNTATQPTTADQPTLTANAVNGLPAITFTGTPQFLQFALPDYNFADFTRGATVFFVAKPSAITAGARFFDFGTATTGNNLRLLEAAAGVEFDVVNASTITSLTSSTALSTTNFQLVEAVQNGAGYANIFNSGVLAAQGALPNIVNIARTGNFLAKANNAANYFSGQMAEILIYNRVLTSSERQGVEGYINAKYQFAIGAPVITPGNSINSSAQTVSITADPDTTIYYNENGGTFVTYSGPFNITATTTVQSYAVRTSTSQTSTTTTALIQIDATTASIPRNNLVIWVKSDNGVTLSGSTVSRWTDFSGQGNDATQPTALSQPGYATGVVNGLPALTFNGTAQWLQYAFPDSSFADFTQGATLFVVAQPTTITAGRRFLDFATNTTRDNVRLLEAASGLEFDTVNSGATVTSVISSTALDITHFQLLEAVEGAGFATVYQNGVNTASGAVNDITNVARTGNFLGKANNAANYFSGQIAEVLLYNRKLSASERVAVEGYINNKYVFAIGAPVITPGAGVFSGTQTITITADPNVAIFYNENGGSFQSYSVPFAVNSTTTIQAYAVRTTPAQTSATTTAFIQIDPTTANVTKTNLLAWLKSDNGVILNSSTVSRWMDLSGNSNDATQATTASQPVFVTGAVNSLPALNFTGTPLSMQFVFPDYNFADFTQGASIFMVTKPTTITSLARFLDFGTNTNTNNLRILESAPSGIEFDSVSSVNVISSLISSSGLSSSAFQTIEAIQNGNGSAAIYSNGVQAAQGALTNFSNVARTGNFLCKANNNANYFNGEVAEVLIYNRGLSNAERVGVEGYLNNRYLLAIDAPYISPGSGSYTSAQTISLTSDPGVNIYYTVDGSTPNSSKTLYTAPFMVSSSTTVKAIAIRTSPSMTSTVSTAYIQINNATPVTGNGMILWLRGDLGVTTSGSNVTQWSDLSGSGNDLSQTNGSAQPTFVTNAVNSLPAVNFNGTSQYFNFPGSSTFSDFSQGESIFAVLNPATGGPHYVFDVSNGAVSNNLTVSNTGTTGTFTVVKNGSTSGLSATSSLILGQYQLLEAFQTSTTGTIKVNGVQKATGTLNAPVVIARTMNHVGTNYNASADFYQGGLAELIVFNRYLSGSEQAQVESYLMQKYQPVNTAPPAPAISVAGGPLPGPTLVALSAQNNAIVYYTLDGTTPTTSSAVYTGPINVYYTLTLNAIAVESGVQSAVSSAAYTLNATQWPAPNPSDPTILNINLQLPPNAH